jgi:RsiW-degrading membrane proteinase PrsW (M82 family)
MSFQDKLEAAQKELGETKIWKSNRNPPISVLLRKLGLKIRPFHYNSFTVNFLITSIWFGCIWGVLMWFTTWKSQNMPIQIALITSISGGLLFGLLMAFYYKRSAKKHSLSEWQKL